MLPLNPLKRLWTHKNQLWRSIVFAAALPGIILKGIGSWFWFFYCGKPTRNGITQISVHIIRLNQGPITNSWLLWQKGPIVNILLQTKRLRNHSCFQHSAVLIVNKDTPNLDVPVNFVTEEVDSNLLLLTNNTLLQHKNYVRSKGVTNYLAKRLCWLHHQMVITTYITNSSSPKNDTK